jgi:hypothetical protein
LHISCHTEDIFVLNLFLSGIGGCAPQPWDVPIELAYLIPWVSVSNSSDSSSYVSNSSLSMPMGQEEAADIGAYASI